MCLKLYLTEQSLVDVRSTSEKPSEEVFNMFNEMGQIPVYGQSIGSPEAERALGKYICTYMFLIRSDNFHSV